jgi:hypothetical protein
MGKKITQYPNNVSVNPDLNSLLDLSEKTGTTTFESRKWTLTAFKTWVNSWVVAGSVAWSSITGKPTTLSGYGITDAVDGSGTTDYVPKWTDSNTLTDSSIRETGGKVGVNVAPDSAIRLKVKETSSAVSLRSENTWASATSDTTTGSFQNDAVNPSNNNYGVNTLVSGSAVANVGVQGRATGTGTSNSIGGDFSAEGTTANKHAVRLADGTQAVGKYLKCVDTDGKANWGWIDISDVTSLQTSLDAKFPLNPRIQTVTSSATVTPTSTNDLVTITAQATGLTLANPTGTFVEGQSLMIRIKDNGTARAITFGADYRAIGITLPTTTVISKTMYLGIIYNSTDGKFDILGLNQQA